MCRVTKTSCGALLVVVRPRPARVALAGESSYVRYATRTKPSDADGAGGSSCPAGRAGAGVGGDADDACADVEAACRSTPSSCDSRSCMALRRCLWRTDDWNAPCLLDDCSRCGGDGGSCIEGVSGLRCRPRCGDSTAATGVSELRLRPSPASDVGAENVATEASRFSTGGGVAPSKMGKLVRRALAGACAGVKTEGGVGERP